MLSRDVIRLALFAAVAAANAAIAAWGAGGAPPAASIAGAVRMGALATLWGGAYLGLAALWRNGGHLKDMPRLSLESVAVYAYGGGLLAFVTTYVALGLHSGSVAAYLLTVAGLCMGDAIEREAETAARRLCVLAASGLSIAAALVASYAEDEVWVFAAAAFDEGNWPEVFYGLLLPLAAPFVQHFTRDRRYYPPGAVSEMVQLAMPFAAVVALIALATAPGAAGTAPAAPAPGLNDTDSFLALASGIRRDQFAEALLPLTTLPVLFFVTQSAILYSTADCAAVFAAVVAGRHWGARPHEAQAALALALAAAGVALRIASEAAFLAHRPERPYTLADIDAEFGEPEPVTEVHSQPKPAQ